jgi:hypothetical protein
LLLALVLSLALALSLVRQGRPGFVRVAGS